MSSSEKNRQITGIMLIYALTSLLMFLIVAISGEGLGNAVASFGKLVTMPSQMTLDTFKNASVGATFLNAGLVGLSCVLVFVLTGADLSGTSLMSYFLTLGFAFYAMNMINIWPCMLGTLLFAAVTKQAPGKVANHAVFATALAPFVSEFLFRYEMPGGMAMRILAAVLCGVFVGFFMPIMTMNGVNLLKGYSVYNAASAAGPLAIFVFAMMFKAPGVDAPSNTDIGESQMLWCMMYIILSGVIALIYGWFINGKSFKGVTDVFKKTGYKCDLGATPGLAAMNIALLELFMTVYYIAVGTKWSSPCLAAVVCLMSTAASGAHILNVIPILIGYVLGAGYGTFTINAPAIVLGVCFATALAPVSGCFGVIPGIVAGFMHAVMVTQVVTFYAAFCFYNGGFTDAIIVMMLGPVLEYYFARNEEYHFQLLPKKK